jgi:hypothetical protein
LFVILGAALAIAAAVSLIAAAGKAHGRLWWLLILPVPWIATAAVAIGWGNALVDKPAWVRAEPWAALAAEIVAVAWLAVWLAGARIAALATGAFNLYLTFWCSLILDLAVKGDLIRP